MLEMMRIQSNQSAEESFLSAAAEMMYLDDAQSMIADILLDERPSILAHYFDLTLDGSLRYFIPDSIPYNYEKILLVEDYTSSDSPYSTSTAEWFDRMQYFEGLHNTARIVWSVIDQYLEFPNKETGKTMRVWYTRRPVGLWYGTTLTGNTSTIVAFPTTPTAGEIVPEDDYYNGMKIYSAGQVRTISDYVASTNKATISAAWGTTPTDSTTVIGLLSSLPDRMHMLIPNIGARLIKAGNDDDTTEIRRLIDEQIKDIIKRIKLPTTQRPQVIRKVGYNK